MSFSINTNITSLQAQNYLQQSSNFQAKTISEVTSGLRIVNSGDDAAGLAIANGYRSDEAVLTQGIQNANNGTATLQTIDGGMSNISTLLDRARTLATESASGTFTGDRSTLNSEFQSVISEVTRQATNIGMNQGGEFAKQLSVFIGGGQGATSAQASTNGSINLDLSQSAVDAQSLGLQGVQAAGNSTTDIGSGSSATSVQSILANAKNSGSEGTAGYTTFSFSGSGFSDSNQVSISVNLAGVTDTTTLATAINAAIASSGNGTTQASTAFKNAGITATVVTNASGQQQLAFNSSNSAFQVQAGDQTANALLGNFAQNASLEGTDNSATLSTNGLGFSSLNVNGTAVNLAASTIAKLAGGSVATAGSLTGSATVSDSAVATALGAKTAGDAVTLALYVNGSSTASNVVLKGGETTLAQVASEITGAGIGVTASVTGSGSTEALTLTSNATGSTSNVVVATATTTALVATGVTGLLIGSTGNAGTNGTAAVATSGAVAGTYTTASTLSASVATIFVGANATANVTAATLDLNVNGVQQSIALSSATTLANIVSEINSSSAGVTASLATNTSAGTESLVLTSNDTGSSSNVTVLVSASTTGLAAALGYNASSNTAGTAGVDAAAPLSKGAVVSILNSDANFSSVATASLDGNKVVIQSNLNSANSSVQATGTLATALGFAATTATAAAASTGASLKTTVQSDGTLGNISQSVITSLKTPSATISAAANNNVLSLSVNGGTAVNLTLSTAATNAALVTSINTSIAGSSLAGQVSASLDSNGYLHLTATKPGQTVAVVSGGTDDASTDIGFSSNQSSGTATNAFATSSDNIKVQFTGGGMTSPVTLSLSPTTAGVTKMSDILADLTSRVANNSALAAAGISLTTSTSGNNLVFTDSKGQNFQVAVTGDTTNALGFGSFNTDVNGNFSYSTITGTSSLPTANVTNTGNTGTLNFSLNGGATTAVNVALKSVSGTVTGANSVTDASIAAGVAGLTSGSLLLVVNGVAGTGISISADTTLAQVAATINAATVTAAGAAVTADVVGTGANQQLRITSDATGTSSSVTVVAGSSGTGASAAQLVGLSVGQSGTGLANAAAVQADAVNQINAAIAGNASLTGAGIQASVVDNKLVLSSTNDSNFRVNGGGAANLGFGINGASYNGTTNSAAPTVGRVDSAGAYATSSMNFTAITSGADSQNIAITAVDASGDSHSTSITLQNNTTSQSGSNIDAALHAINTQLQQSNDPTLQSIVAVKEDNSNGTESIKFQSTTQNFKVAVSSLSDGTGITAPAGGVSTAAQNGTGANASIDTIAGAEAAVNALATAVQNLGTAQAAVGKGENLLNYATSLAQSQLTNEAASESALRDANLAQEAANLTKAQILVQAGTAALSQANSAPQQLISLLQGH